MTDAAPDSAECVPDTSGTTRDAFLDGRLSLLQPSKGPRAAIDALYLAAAVPAREGKGEAVLEAGTGTGIAALALCARVADARATGVEVQPSLLELARENTHLNGMDDRLTLVGADITAAGDGYMSDALPRESFDHVMANPPYFVSGESRQAADRSAARAYSAQAGDLEKWIAFLTAMAAPRGTLTLIHRAAALNQLLALLGGRFGALTVYPLFPKAGVAAKRVLIQGVKGSRAPLRLLPGMILHEADGAYTREADGVLREMAGIDLGAR